jgi:nitroreductase
VTTTTPSPTSTQTATIETERVVNRPITSETIETLNARVSIRDYTDEPLDDATLHVLLNAARRSPTSSNTQTYSFIVVRDPEAKRELARLTGEQKHVETCPAFVVICADIARLATATTMHDGELAVNLEASMVSIVDAAIAGQSLALAAESLGLGAVMIGGIRNQPAEVIELLGLPGGVFPVYGLCLGWPDEARRTPQKPRLPEAAVIHYERYAPADTAMLAGHDAELAAHYREQGRQTPDAAWTGVLAKRFSRRAREHLRGVLEAQGFSFD